MSQNIVILTEGQSNPHAAKTATGVVRYRPADVVAVIDSTNAGKTFGELLGVGGDLPVVASLDGAPSANTLLIGIAPPGGKIPDAWRAVILDAIARGMDVISGLHEFLSDDDEFASAAAERGVQLIDVRKLAEAEKDIARRVGLRDECLRIHTVGHDCSIGKMVTSVEITNGLKKAGQNAKFIATGQTGIMVAGDGCPVDRVVADFVSGAVEKLILQHQHHDILVIEGQGSLVHPSYSGVTLSLLHGCFPHALILCYEVGREIVTGFTDLKIPPLSTIKSMFETMAGIERPCPVIGVSMNGSTISAQQAKHERQRVRDELGVPVCDIFRNGTDEIIQAILDFKNSRS